MSGAAERPRVVFFGSPDFAVPTLQALLESPYRPLGVVAQPDRPAGRGRRPARPPTAELAAAAGITVLQPPRLRDPQAIAAVAALQADLQIVAAYGQLLPPAVLEAPRWGTLNVHSSLLPRWRGAAPVSAAILAGDEQTGATIMLLDETEDTGPILAQRGTLIGERETAGQLSDRLAALGAALLLETIPRWLDGELEPQPQDASRATRARRVRKQAGAIDWTADAAQIARQVRAYTPWPGAFCELEGQRVRLAAVTAEDGSGTPPSTPPGTPPGVIIAADEVIRVAAGGGIAVIERLQRAGKRELSAAEFVRGAGGLVGKRFRPLDG